VKLTRADEGDELVLNLTTMTDIVFLMLVFFMLATTFVDPERALGVELPGAQSSAETPADELVVNVLEDGSFVVSGETLSREALQAHLERTARSAPDTPVTIRGHRRAHHEAIVTVMDACGLAGLTNLSVGTSERDSRG
jgi:biopolymer transport protein ExbD